MAHIRKNTPVTVHNSSSDTYSPCLGWQLSVYHLHPASPLLSFSFKCRWHSCLPFYLFICCCFFSFFISNTHRASILSSVCVPWVSFSWPLFPPYLIFVSFLLVSYKGTFGDIFNHYSGHFNLRYWKCSILDCMGITCLCSATLSCQCFRGIGLPIRSHCFLVTAQMQHLHRECAVPKWWLPHSLFFSISSQ